MEEKAFALGVGRAAVVDPTDAKEGAGLWRTPWLPDPTRWRSLLGDELHHHAAAATPPVQKTRGEMIYIYIYIEREREREREEGSRGTAVTGSCLQRRLRGAVHAEAPPPVALCRHHHHALEEGGPSPATGSDERRSWPPQILPVGERRSSLPNIFPEEAAQDLGWRSCHLCP
jgi:hypothetical protein